MQFDLTLAIISLLASWVGCYTLFIFNVSVNRSMAKNRQQKLAIYSTLAGIALFGIHFLNILTFVPHLTIGFNLAALLIGVFFGCLNAYALLEASSQNHLPIRNLFALGLMCGLACLIIFRCQIDMLQLSNVSYDSVYTLIATLLCGAVAMLCAIIMYWAKNNISNRYITIKKILMSGAISIALFGAHQALNASLSYSSNSKFGLVQNMLSSKTTGLIISLGLICLFLFTFIVAMFYDKLTNNSFKATLFKQSDFNSTSTFETVDTLTNLPNRHSFNQHLESNIKRCERIGSNIALAYIDLDHFKPINDTFGHHVGDKLLAEVAKRLNTAVRGCDIVGRIGGDEFVALLTEINQNEDVTPIVERILSAIREPYLIDKHVHEISCSIGIALHKPEQNSSKLMEAADAAMYQAKRNGKNQYSFIEQDFDKAIEEAQALFKELREAIDKKQFILHLQPVFESVSKRIVGAEALLRWAHPTRGILRPDVFIPTAEKYGLMRELNEIVLDQACGILTQAKSFQLSIHLSVNLSNQQFREPNLAAHIAKKLAAQSLNPSDLAFEIADINTFKNQPQFKKIMGQFNDARLKVALDNFGLHALNLFDMKDLSIYKLKLDKSLVHQVSRSNNDLMMVDALIRLAHALNMLVQADGIETETQQQLLTDLDCDLMQGHYFYPALSIDQFFRLVQRSQRNYSQNGHYGLAKFNLAV